MKRCLVVVACLVSPLALAGPASGAEPQAAPAAPAGGSESAPSDTAKARALFEEGSKASEQGNWSECRTKLLEAWSLLKIWQVAANLGACELNLGMPREAAEHVTFALRALPKDADPSKGAELKALLDAASARIVTLTIKTDPPDAEVLLDGRPLGKGPLDGPVFIEAGTHALEIRAAGRQTFTGSIDARAGQRQDINQRLDPLPAAQPPPPPILPPPPPPSPPPAPVAPAAPKGPEPRLWPIALGGAVAVAALGTGLGLSAASDSKRDDASAFQRRLGPSACAEPPEDPEACSTLSSALSSKDTLRDASTVSFVLGGVVALGTAGYAVWELSRTRGGAEVRAAPALGMTGGGVVVVGSW